MKDRNEQYPANPHQSRCCCIVVLAILLLMAFFVVDYVAHQMNGPGQIFVYYMIPKTQREAYDTLKKFGCWVHGSPVGRVEYFFGNPKRTWIIEIKKKKENDSLLEIKDALAALNPETINMSCLRESLTDEELTAIENVTNVRHLDLEGSSITDKSIPLLLSFPKLTFLDVANTCITEDGLSRIVQDIEPGRKLIVSASCEMSKERYEELEKINPNVVLSVRVRPEPKQQ